MKKLLCLFSVLIFCTCLISYSEMTELDYQIKAIRDVKNAKTKPINAQIRKHNANIEQIVLNTNLTEQQKEAKLKKETDAIEVLKTQKDAIQKQYNKDKKALKKAYKKNKKSKKSTKK